MQLLLSLLFVVVAGSAFAQNNRSAVSVNGLDTNSCATTAPCRSFSVAVAHTNPGGEVIAFDSGGFGSFVVTQPITVSGAPGVHAAVTTSSGNAISVSAGPGDEVVLRNLVVLAAGSATNGISISGAKSVHVLNCLVSGFAGGGGVSINGTGAETLMDYLVAQQNGVGVLINTSALVFVRITNSKIDDNLGAGIDVFNDVKAVASNTSLSGNAYGVRLQSTLSTTADMTLDHCIVSSNGVGIYAANPDVNSRAVVRLYGNVISYNIGPGVQTTAATAYTYGNNALSANNPDVSGAALTPLAQN
ncbi:MAG TPA: right-handed parallel beta-helix repeat-containing protein [Thermoanaerobaculia bacterium]